MPGPHKGVSTNVLINKFWQNPDTDLWKETSRLEKG